MKVKVEAMPPKPKRYLTDDEYQFIFSRVPRLCLDFIIINESKQILLARRQIEPFKGFWYLPGGKVNYKETINEAEQRILQTELGCESAENKQVGYIECLDDGPYLHSVAMAFLIRLKNGSLKCDYQSQEMRYFDDIPEHTQPHQKRFLLENWTLLQNGIV